MNGKEIFGSIARGKMPNRIPFVPIVYEHGASLINETPSNVAYSSELLTKAQLTAFELYQPDLISVGLDIYNIEAEALGVPVIKCDNNDLPSLDGFLLEDGGNPELLTVPNPEKDGRMPLFLEASEMIYKEIGQYVNVNGCVVGPYTLAALLRGFENFVMDLYTDPEYAMQLLEFTTRVTVTHAESYIKRGLGVSINESWIAPPLLSPEMYTNLVLPLHKKMFIQMKSFGGKGIGLICGGNTSEIAESLAESGSSLLMADSSCDHNFYKGICKGKNISIRASIDSKLVEIGDYLEIDEAAKRIITVYSDYEKFIFGCGIVSFNTDPKSVISLKNIVNQYSHR